MQDHRHLPEVRSTAVTEVAATDSVEVTELHAPDAGGGDTSTVAAATDGSGAVLMVVTKVTDAKVLRLPMRRRLDCHQQLPEVMTDVRSTEVTDVVTGCGRPR